MKNRISRILLATDGSESSMIAAEYAFSLAAHYHAGDLIVLHVLPIGIKKEYFDYNPEDIPAWIRKNLLEYKHEVQGWFDRIEKKHQSQRGKQKQQPQQHESKTANINLKTDIVDLMTSVAGTIVSYAEEEEVDLVVIGTKGMSGIKRMLLGSVAEGVVMYNHCPVLVVK